MVSKLKNTQDIFLVKEYLNEQGAMADNVVCFSTIEKAREYIAKSRTYYLDYCKERKYQVTQVIKYYDDWGMLKSEEDYSNDMDNIYIEQTNKKRKPFTYCAEIEKVLLN